MGGYPPLVYDVKARKLVVNEVEAETVRYIFRRYQRSVRLLKEHLDAAGIVSKHRTAPDGRPPVEASRLFGGRSITCCKIAYIAARSCTMTSPILASTTRSWMMISGRECNYFQRQTGSIVASARATAT